LRGKTYSLSINRYGATSLNENCAKNEGSDIRSKTLSPYAACIKNYFIFFIISLWGVTLLNEKYAENEGVKKLTIFPQGEKTRRK
jgi:hypothetical protein